MKLLQRPGSSCKSNCIGNMLILKSSTFKYNYWIARTVWIVAKSAHTRRSSSLVKTLGSVWQSTNYIHWPMRPICNDLLPCMIRRECVIILAVIIVQPGLNGHDSESSRLSPKTLVANLWAPDPAEAAWLRGGDREAEKNKTHLQLVEYTRVRFGERNLKTPVTGGTKDNLRQN